MRNIKLLIQYDGTNYHGWQIQPGQKTVQGVLQNKLSRIIKADVLVSGAGRTDSGVHALGQVASFKTESGMTVEQFKIALNSILPRDIAISNVQEVDSNFHARYSAKGRTYIYTILNGKTPSAFLANYTYQVPKTINIKSMSAACETLVGTQDFSSFASTGDSVKNFIRTIKYAGIQDTRHLARDNECLMPFACAKYKLIHFRVEATAFLRCMVRAITGTLLEIGKGKIPAEKMRDIIDAKDREAAGPNLPSRGLCLVKVDY